MMGNARHANVYTTGHNTNVVYVRKQALSDVAYAASSSRHLSWADSAQYLAGMLAYSVWYVARMLANSVYVQQLGC